MSNPIWVTQMNLGSTAGGVPVNPYQLIADAVLPAITVTYSFVGGTFPLGLTVNANGIITGTPNAVLTNTVYNFIVKATDNLGNTTNKTFMLEVTVNMQIPVWNTVTGSLGTIPSNIPFTQQLSASAVLPAITVSYSIISGSLPSGLSMNTSGLITGTPALVAEPTTNTFVVRATDNLQNKADRTFSITYAGTAIPEFTTPGGALSTLFDSEWYSYNINYNNPLPSNPVTVRLVQGSLPPGLEINEIGLIRGYPTPPTIQVNLEQVITTSTSTSSVDNTITCFSTAGFSVARPVVFTGTVIGGVIVGETYYIKQITSATNFTISESVDGPVLSLTTNFGSMTITLPNFTVGQPTIRTYPFTLKLESPLGGDSQSYTITVVNQNTPVSEGGPGNTNRQPTIYNTRPTTFDIPQTDEYYGYYVLPPGSQIAGNTYDPAANAYIGQINSGDEFNFKIIGHDFDGDTLKYRYNNGNPLPFGLIGDSDTGWITGTPTISNFSIEEENFTVEVYKEIDNSYFYIINFSLRITNNLLGVVSWYTGDNLGTIFNGTISDKYVEALSDVPLTYTIIDGELPPNLTLLENGEIVGVVAYQPTNTLLPANTTTTFTFTVEAYNIDFPIISSTRTFTIDVFQKYNQPTDTLYIKCTPSIEDRYILDSLLLNQTIIPNEALYRPDDPYFGKATNVTYVHAYGIYASSLSEYLASVTKNHYWRSITLGELSTAVAKDASGNIIYEVVYSNVIDNLINPKGVSIPEEIYWPRFINLSLGPWYTSITNLYTSYEQILGQQYYTSLTPGYARILYPNSLPNMRDRVGQELGVVNDSNLLPLWMTSQQSDGNTLGFTNAWVICYTKPGQSEIVKKNIETLWLDSSSDNYKLNKINFQIDRFSVDKSTTYNYDNSLIPPAWTGLPSATPVPVPLDSEDFYVLFPQETILPDETQY